MLMTWIHARDAVEAGSALADTFPMQTVAQDAVGKFLDRAAAEVRTHRLSFYKRVRFASAFKLRLVENGVQAETAAEVTQTLLVRSLMLVDPASASALAASEHTSGNTPTQAVDRKSSETLFREAAEHMTRGAYAEAVDAYQELIAQRPRYVEARNSLGLALMKLGRNTEAETQFRKAISHKPNFHAPHVGLGTLLLSVGRFPDAENCFRRALSLKPADISARCSLGQTLISLGRFDLARAELEKVLKVAPRHADTLFARGVLARSEGRFSEAEDLFQRALAGDPKMTRARSAQAFVRKMTSADSAWLKGAEQAAAQAKAAPEEASLRFAIGKYFDDVGRYESAFSSYKRANELVKSVGSAYDRDVHTRFVDDMIRVYTPESVLRAKSAGSVSTKPVFIVGMPRSGTSLAEQILASHPAVGGAGELPFWNDVVRRYDELARVDLFGDKLRDKIASDYLSTLEQQCPDAGYVIDKMPRNADYLGIIQSVFPQARIIYMRRDPIDTCLSCYFQHFSTTLSYTSDLSDLASYYTEHARLMAHWRKALPPGTILDVPYEELVADPEQWTRRMLEFLGLEWDERCLKFHETQRPVLTSSFWQVRQKLYGGSVQRWRNYAKFIGPLRNLKPA